MENEMSYKIEGKILITEQGKIEFPDEITKVLPCDDVLAVTIKITPESPTSKNLYGVKDGKIIWRADSIILGGGTYDISRFEDGILKVWIYDYTVHIDPATGKILEKILTK